MPFQLEPFRPARGAANPHAQTILANALRPTGGVAFLRRRLPTPDGDFVDLDFAYVRGYRWLWRAPGEGAPLVLALHGLEGSARRGYMCELYRQLARRGVRSVGLNFRSCSGEINRTTKMYNAGATADVHLALDWLAEQFPGVRLGLVGFSLGANVTLKALGEGARVQAAAAVSPPFDLGAGSDFLDNPLGRRYMARILRSLRRKARLKAAQIGHLVDLEAVLAARTFREFDDAWAPIHGFANADDYYAHCSSARFLGEIRQPALILRALDDPFFAPHDMPREALAANDCLQAGLTAHGGHVAFMEGKGPGQVGFWAERQAARFLRQMLAE